MIRPARPVACSRSGSALGGCSLHLPRAHLCGCQLLPARRRPARLPVATWAVRPVRASEARARHVGQQKRAQGLRDVKGRPQHSQARVKSSVPPVSDCSHALPRARRAVVGACSRSVVYCPMSAALPWPQACPRPVSAGAGASRYLSVGSSSAGPAARRSRSFSTSGRQ